MDCQKALLTLTVILAMYYMYMNCQNLQFGKLERFAPLPEKSKKTENEESDEEASDNEEDDIERVNQIMGYTGDATMTLGEEEKMPLGKCGAAGQFLSTNLLPKNDPQMQEFNEFAPDLEGKNFVDAYKFVFGSQSQSLRNANYQLRSDPPNPQGSADICPWMKTTITPEDHRPLEIGAGN